MNMSRRTSIFKIFFKDFDVLGKTVTANVNRCKISARSFAHLSCSLMRNGTRSTTTGSGRSSGYYRWFYCSSSILSPLHFDTHSLVTKLQDNGYSKEQAEVMSTCLLDVLNLCLKDVHDTNASKIEQERLEMKLQTSINEIKKEMFLLEQSKFTKIKDENERLKEKVKAVENLLAEEIAKLKSSTKLDLSLEKSLTREELAIRDQKIKDNANKIETEIAKLGTLMETQKLDLIKYLVGSLLSVTTVVLAVWRFLKA